MSDTKLQAFKDIVWQHFELYGRHDLPWRIPDPSGSFDPYKILVSEIMLQQTQVPRVVPKYMEFLSAFPTLDALATAPLSKVLTLWSGLGYNRRAKYVWQAARAVHEQYNGVFPQDAAVLTRLPGVGSNTAGAILAYAFNEPTGFVETNIRTVYIFHFFQGRVGIADKEILALVKATLPTENSRIWYWALMDYGAFLKQTVGNLNKLSKTYARQSSFEGSARQIRGKVIRLLSVQPMSKSALAAHINDERLEKILEDLMHESLIAKTASLYTLR